MEKVQISCNTELAYIREGLGFPVILIHGLDGNLASLCTLKDELKENYDVITYDVRGHGKSSKSNAFHLKDHVEDLKLLMKHLNIEKAHLVGHDMGGLIAKHFVDKYESKVESLTLIACNLIDSVLELNKLMIEHEDEIEGFDKSESLILLLPYMYKDQEKAKKWFQSQLIYNRQSAEESAVATRALMEFPVFNQNIVLEQTNIPTLIVNGIYDPLITQEMKHKYDQVFHNLEMVEFNQSGHAPHIEEPNHFLEVFLGFVKTNEYSER
ncbi:MULTISPECIES: alpha/beta fold hydrolase [Staphylococcus]|uniref:Alpha/beta hydrolase n=1 Tax=Staphylococcus ureilyticus TaxID=94138 RepID=A0AB34AF29_STAUR|nr:MULTISPECIES: alpha/beta hydrolase [Staphylococcus]AVL76669.1 alpha/beta hydrolase [Staphylococcus cohnii]MBL0377460.1 alpha/beta hydrolase [Staphylococcus sp. S75]MBL0382560.1 alpha/beta hydrolase [Staphylococcus sp. S59]MBL0401358.1 alpha/beta hydrolase [Staphylococcus sp. S36]MCT1915308.1 alpha/beta hydrolase [Staphylococcus ureilyticus]